MTEELAKFETHNLMLENRNRLHLTGVTDVDSFDETAVVAYTALGELTVTGSALHIQSLNTETGDLTLEGSIVSMVYLDNAPKNSGLFARLFR